MLLPIFEILSGAEVIIAGTQLGVSFNEEVSDLSIQYPKTSVIILRTNGPNGRGAAIRAAIERARGDFCVIQDPQYPFVRDECKRLLKPLDDDVADVVVQAEPDHRKLLNRLVESISNVKNPEVEFGCIAFRTALAQTLPLFSDGFGLGCELIIQFARRHARFATTEARWESRKRLSAFIGVCTVLRARWLYPAHQIASADMLVAMSDAHRFNRWMADTIMPWIKGNVVELGAGIGNLTVLLAPKCTRYLATDGDEDYLLELRSRTADSRNIRLARCEFTDVNDIEPLLGTADTVVCLNVLEHVAEDEIGLANIRACLKSGGRTVVLVPQGPSVMGTFDEVLEHRRRYTKSELREKMERAGFVVEAILEFNRATWPGWYLNSRILRKRTLSRFQLWCFDLLVPLLRHIDRFLPWPPTSLIAIGKSSEINAA